jgi:hypothetical protein
MSSTPSSDSAAMPEGPPNPASQVSGEVPPPVTPDRAAAVDHDPAPKPFLLHLAPLALVVFGLQSVYFGLTLYGSRGSGSVLAFGSQLSGGFSHGLASWVLMVSGGILLACAWGFWADRLWARSLLVGYLVVMAVASLVFGARHGGLIMAVAYALPSGLWLAFVSSYLYDSPKPEAYFARLQREEEAREAARAAGG